MAVHPDVHRDPDSNIRRSPLLRLVRREVDANAPAPLGIGVCLSLVRFMEMTFDRIVYHHITDPPFILRSNTVLKNTHFCCTGTDYGRVIFKWGPMIVADGSNIRLENNQISGWYSGTPMPRLQLLRWRWRMFKMDLGLVRQFNQSDPSILRNLLRLKLRWLLKGDK
jgi:hypothetical protein